MASREQGGGLLEAAAGQLLLAQPGHRQRLHVPFADLVGAGDALPMPGRRLHRCCRRSRGRPPRRTGPAARRAGRTQPAGAPPPCRPAPPPPPGCPPRRRASRPAPATTRAREGRPRTSPPRSPPRSAPWRASRSFCRTANRAATAIARARSCGVPVPEASPISNQCRASSSSPEADQYRSSCRAMVTAAAASSRARAWCAMAVRRFACSSRSRRSQSTWCGPHASRSKRETSSAYQRGVPLLDALELAVLLGPLEPELPDVGEHAVARVARGGHLGEDDRLVDERAHQVENLVGGQVIGTADGRGAFQVVPAGEHRGPRPEPLLHRGAQVVGPLDAGPQ